MIYRIISFGKVVFTPILDGYVLALFSTGSSEWIDFKRENNYDWENSIDKVN